MDTREYLYTVTGGFKRIPQTVIIDGGTDGSRRDAADVLAAVSVCEKKIGCGECIPCKKAKEHNHTEITYVEREKDKKTITVAMARSIRSNAFVNPVEGDTRVFIIPEADRLGEEAQNALLKILEEPPVFDRFVLCTENASALLNTIRSRSVRITLPIPFEADMTGKDGENAQKIARAVLNGDEAQFVFLLPKIEKDRNTALSAVQKLKLIFRDALVLKHSGKAVTNTDASVEMADNFSDRRITECIRVCEHTEKMLDSNVKIGLSLTVMFSDLITSKSL